MNILMKVAITALTYALLGRLGLTLAVPPGYASPVFPAAGLAIALALKYGRSILPGVWLGSMIINLTVMLSAGEFEPHGAVSACMIASGAALQTWFATFVVNRWGKRAWHRLETEQDISRFLALAAPLGCIISASTGTATLYLTSLIKASDIIFTWWTWWIGDTFGVLIFAPLTLIVLYRGESPWKERQRTVAIPMLLTLCIAVSAFLSAAQWEQKQLHEKIEEYSESINQNLYRRLVAHQEALSSLRRLIEVSPDMTFDQFDYFTKITLNDNSDIFALSYNWYLPDSLRNRFELEMAARTGFPDFRITERNVSKKLVPALKRPYYVSVGYIAPIDKNRAALGFDINSDPVRRIAINKAIQTGKPTATSPIQLVQDNQKRPGVLVINPAYKRTQSKISSIEQKLAGFAVCVIKTDELAQIATRGLLQQGLVFRLSDPNADQGSRIIFQSDCGSCLPMKSFTIVTKINLADRVWELTVFPTEDFLKKHRSLISWFTGIFGLLFVALLQTIMLAVTGRSSEVQSRVRAQTIELSEAKSELEALNQSLQSRVDASVAELRQKDQVLISQSRQAAMGEMIGNIAHQWRQPLNSLSMLIANIQQSHHYNELTTGYMNEATETANRLIQKMSSTISDFRNFFRPDKEMVVFSAQEQIGQAVSLVEAAFKSSGIEITVDKSLDFKLDGFPNEYSQVLLNLLTNAKDAIIESESLPGSIEISLKTQGTMGIVVVKDNGGGIPEEVLSKVFEPYFSTKNMGTGIGLYMSKMIIERNMSGGLTAYNIDRGCVFEVSSPLAREMQ